MVKKIERTFWICDECGSELGSSQAAVACAKKDVKRREEEERKVKEKERLDNLSNLVRLEAETVDQIPELIIKYAKEHMGLQVQFVKFPRHLGTVSNSRAAPLGKSRSFFNHSERFPGISGQCVSVVMYEGKNITHRCLFEHPWSNEHNPGFRFRALHLGSGGGNDQGLYYFLEDFPKLWEKYQEYLQLKEKKDEYIEGVEDAKILTSQKLQEKLTKDEKYQALVSRQAKLDAMVALLQAEKTNIWNTTYKEIFGELEPEKTYDEERMQELKKELGVI